MELLCDCIVFNAIFNIITVFMMVANFASGISVLSVEFLYISAWFNLLLPKPLAALSHYYHQNSGHGS